MTQTSPIHRAQLVTVCACTLSTKETANHALPVAKAGWMFKHLLRKPA